VGEKVAMWKGIIGVLGMLIIIGMKYLVDFLSMKYGPNWVKIVAMVDLWITTIFIIGVLIFILVSAIKKS
jgi:hypothetical protein